MPENLLLRCSQTHSRFWLITYDIGNGKTENMLVCDECYSTNSSFRLFVISKEFSEKIPPDMQEKFLKRKTNSKEVKQN